MEQDGRHLPRPRLESSLGVLLWPKASYAFLILLIIPFIFSPNFFSKLPTAPAASSTTAPPEHSRTTV